MSLRKKILIAYILIVFLSSCSSPGIINGGSITNSQKEYIEELGLLDKDERIVLFSSNMDFESSGNFITNKRAAAYWIRDKEYTRDYALYGDIKNIEVTRGDGFEHTTQIKVIRHDESSFSLWINDQNRKREDEFIQKLRSRIN